MANAKTVALSLCLALTCARSESALAQPSGISSVTLPPIGDCGRPLPVVLANAGDLKSMFDVDPAVFARDIETTYAKDIAGSCARSRALRDAVSTKVLRVCFVGAAGADEPLPYLAGRVLVIEAAPDDYRPQRFRTALAKAIARGSVAEPIEDCASR